MKPEFQSQLVLRCKSGQNHPWKSKSEQRLSGLCLVKIELVQENVITENKNKLQCLLQLEMKDL